MRSPLSIIPWRDVVLVFGIAVFCIVIGRDVRNTQLVALGAGVLVIAIGLLFATWCLNVGIAKVQASTTDAIAQLDVMIAQAENVRDVERRPS